MKTFGLRQTPAALCGLRRRCRRFGIATRRDSESADTVRALPNFLPAFLAALFLLALANTARATTYYVATNGSDSADGTTWATAKQTIQAAINLTVTNDTVLLSNGVYSTGSTVAPDGGLSRVAIATAITVQSVNGPSNTFIVGQGPVGTNAVRCVYVADGAVLSGFTLTNGFTQSGQNGGGIYCPSTIGVVSNCMITGNWADNYGGGSFQGALNNCVISGNSALFGGGSYGSILNNSVLTGNTAITRFDGFRGYGGGSCLSTLNNCVLSGNSAANNGGGSFQDTLNNCILTGNAASFLGGGSFYSTLNNCTLSANTAQFGGGGAAWGTLNNCIIYSNSENWASYESPTLNDCCTTPMPTNGTGNITNVPQFVDAANSNFHLKTTSPCIDKGNNAYVQGTTDLDGNPRIAYGVVDMGAYEAQFPVGYWTWSGSITNGLTNLTDSASGDGYPNLLKYATGSSPTNSDGLAAMNEVTTSNGIFALNFNRNTNASDVTLIVEGANDLLTAPWLGIATNLDGAGWNSTNVVETGTGTPVSVMVQDTTTATNRFLRLRVTRP